MFSPLNTVILVPSGGIPPTSYANLGGTGVRGSIITITASFSFNGGAVGALIDGTQADTAWFNNSTTNGVLLFDFGLGPGAYIDEVSWYQSSASANGTWTLERSDDNVDWVGSTSGSIVPASAATVVTPFTWLTKKRTRYHRLRQTAGTTSGIPFVREIEFKLA